MRRFDVVQSQPYERAVAVFEAFLRHAREPQAGAGTPVRAAPTPSAAPDISDVDTHETRHDERTDPNLEAVTETGGPVSPVAHEFADVPTRQSQLPAAIAASLAPLPDRGDVWDEQTRERPDVVKDLRRTEEHPAAYPPPEAASVIVDDEVLTDPVGENHALVHVRPESRVEIFLSEMTVLIKYGHAAQVPKEVQLWMRAYPNELAAHLRLAEFEFARVDAAQGLDRLFALAARALDRGEVAVAERVLALLEREAQTDMRFDALRENVQAASRPSYR